MLQNNESNNTLTLLQNISLIKSRCNGRLLHVTKQVGHGISMENPFTLVRFYIDLVMKHFGYFKCKTNFYF